MIHLRNILTARSAAGKAALMSASVFSSPGEKRIRRRLRRNVMRVAAVLFHCSNEVARAFRWRKTRLHMPAHATLRTETCGKSLRDVRKMDPYRFERLVLELLLAMDYGGSRQVRREGGKSEIRNSKTETNSNRERRECSKRQG